MSWSKQIYGYVNGSSCRFLESTIVILNPNNISNNWNSHSKQQQMKNSWKNDIKSYRNSMRFLSHLRKGKSKMSRLNIKHGKKDWKSKEVQPVLIINSTGRITSMPSGIFPLIFQGPLTIPHPGKTKGHPSALTPSPAPAISVSYHSVLNPMGDQPLVVLFSWEGIMFHILFPGPVQYFPLVLRYSFWPDATCQETTRVLTISGWVNTQTLCSLKVPSWFPDVAANRS